MWLRKGLYLLAEFLLLYVFVVGAVFLFFYFATGFDWVVQLIFMVFAVVAVPWCLVMVTVGRRFVDGFQFSDLIHGIYQPVRPLAAMLEAKSAIKAEAQSSTPASEREGTEIWFEPTGGTTAQDVIFALSSHLKSNGISSSVVGGLKVRDGGTLWGINAAADEPVVLVWAETDNQTFYDQVIAGVQSFMTDSMKLTLA